MGNIDQAMEMIFLEDANRFLRGFLDGALGRPVFSVVKHGDKNAVDFWIKKIADKIGEYDCLMVYVVFTYLSDLSDNESRAGGFDGLLGSGDDIRTLRKKLLERFLTFEKPSLQFGSTKQQKIYLFDWLDALFTRAVGMEEAQAFRLKHGNNHQCVNNPYRDNNPDELFASMKTVVRKTLKSMD